MITVASGFSPSLPKNPIALKPLPMAKAILSFTNPSPRVMPRTPYVRSLCLGMFHRWTPDARFMFWTVNFDESGKDDRSPLIIMGAVLANASYWDRFDTLWAAMLARHGLAALHCSELLHDVGWDQEKHDQVLRDAAAIIVPTIPVTLAAVMRKNDYDEIYKSTQPRSGQKHSPLGVLYRASMSFFAAFLEAYPPEGMERVNFVYEIGPKQGGLLGIHDEFMKKGDLNDWLGPLTFDDKTRALGLQAADCFATLSMRKEIEEHGHGATDIGQSSAVMQIDSDHPTTVTLPWFRLPVTREIIGSLRDELLMSKAARAAVLAKTMASLSPSPASPEQCAKSRCFLLGLFGDA